MRELGLSGAHRGKRNRISIPNPQAAHATGRVERHFDSGQSQLTWLFADVTS